MNSRIGGARGKAIVNGIHNPNVKSFLCRRFARATGDMLVLSDRLLFATQRKTIPNSSLL